GPCPRRGRCRVHAQDGDGRPHQGRPRGRRRSRQRRGGPGPVPGPQAGPHDPRHHDAREGRPRDAQGAHRARSGREGRDVLGARPGVQGARVDQARRQGLRRQAVPARPRHRRGGQGPRL
ncbi:MAG: Chemotaxis regulator - transmits chemoreceptor signals to flagellar motor components CheY, partial [uncultured Solirubrobacteraceae bacterium]